MDWQKWIIICSILKIRSDILIKSYINQINLHICCSLKWTETKRYAIKNTSEMGDLIVRAIEEK